MNFTLIENLGEWLKKLNELIVSKIYYVDYTSNKDDSYLPFIYFLLFEKFDYFIKIEGDFDGDHLKLNYFNLSELEEKIIKYDFKNEPDLWCVYDVNQNEKLFKFVGHKIVKVEYGIEKDVFKINGIEQKGEKELITFFRLIFENSQLTFFEGGCGIYACEEKEVKLNFEETFDIYTTK
jgi:hypothetical protein